MDRLFFRKERGAVTCESKARMRKLQKCGTCDVLALGAISTSGKHIINPMILNFAITLSNKYYWPFLP